MTSVHHAQFAPSTSTPATTVKHWPLVATLFVLLAVPGIPALLMILLILFHALMPAELIQLVNPAYLQTPLPILLHGISGVVFFLTIPLQFSLRLRQQFPLWHQRSGGIGVVSALLMAASGIWMHHFLTPADLGMRYVGLWLLSLAIIGCFSMAFYQICQRRFAAHQRWMWRGVAAVLATVSGLLLEVFVALTLGQFDALQPALTQWQHEYARLTALGLNMLLLEVYIRRKSAPV